jgi:hypothetical protein
MRGNAVYLDMARAVDAEQRGGPAAGLAVLAGSLAIEDGNDLVSRCLWLPDVARLALAAGQPDLARAALAAAEADAEAEALPGRVAAVLRIRALLDGDAEVLLDVADRYAALHGGLGIGSAARRRRCCWPGPATWSAPGPR